uniref:Uncharacterized protein n=1 Tax=Anguilla anguilla TaxID=7936 RepID=A0A0E9PA70_ANGAN
MRLSRRSAIAACETDSFCSSN